MKLRDGGATIFLAIAIAYFGGWLYEKSQPKQCWYEVKKSDTETVYQWQDCKPGDEEE